MWINLEELIWLKRRGKPLAIPTLCMRYNVVAVYFATFLARSPRSRRLPALSPESQPSQDARLARGDIRKRWELPLAVLEAFTRKW